MDEGSRPVRTLVDAPDLSAGRVPLHTVANYVHAVLELQALRRKLANAVLEVAHCKKMIASRYQGAILLAEAQASLKELGVESDAL
jgi:hypothetical protein